MFDENKAITHRKHFTLPGPNFRANLMNQISEIRNLFKTKVNGATKISERKILVTKTSDAINSIYSRNRHFLGV